MTKYIEADMEKIAKVLGQKPEFFMSEEFMVPKEPAFLSADVVLGACGRFHMCVGE